MELKIKDKLVGDGHPCYFIADIASNHDGDLNRAKKLIDLAKESGVDAVKFQHFKAEKIVSREGFAGLQAGFQAKWSKPVCDVYKAAEFPRQFTKELKDYAESLGLAFFSSPYDKEAVDELESLNVPAYKIGSGDITWLEMVKYIAGKNKPVILGVGASTMEEIEEAVKAIRSTGNNQIILLQCVTNYPTSFDNANVKVQPLLREKFITLIGYSDHTPGSIVPLASVALGGCMIEKHFTDDKTRTGPDHPFSMEPKEFREMINNARILEKSLGRAVREVYPEEKETVILQRRCLRASMDIPKDTKIAPEMVEALRPAPKGALYPKYLPQIVNKLAKRDIKKGEAFYWEMFGSKEMPNCPKTLELWKEAKKLIPGGTQLLSKRAEQFLPERWPAYFSRAKGIEVWDLDGNKYLDFSLMGVGACTLGYADDEVDDAVKKVISHGSMATLNSPEEVELARLLIQIHPWAEMVRYTRTGGESMAVAVRIARAFTKKDKIAFCGYHGWHDWYLACNLSGDDKLVGHLLPGLEPLGVPKSLLGTALPFEYNKIEQLEELAKNNPNQIAAIVMEPIRHTEPKNNFLQKVREVADKIGAVLIFDEVSAAWRQNVGGSHLNYGINPDIAVVGKAMSNGYPMGAVIGKANILDLAQSSFISSTYWTERIGPAASLATIKKMQRENVPAHLERIGKMIGERWQQLAMKHNLDITIIGPNPLITFSFNYESAQEIKTLFTQEMLKRGFLASLSVYVSYAHKDEQVERYIKAVDEVFGIIKKAVTENKVSELLEGPVAHKGFKRLNW